MQQQVVLNLEKNPCDKSYEMYETVILKTKNDMAIPEGMFPLMDHVL